MKILNVVEIVVLHWGGLDMEPNNKSWKNKIYKASENAGKFEWLFYLIVLSILLPYRIGYIQFSYDDPTGFILLDFILAVNMIAFSTRLAATFRKKRAEKPFATCNNCDRKIDPPHKAKWKCECGMELKFPASKNENLQKDKDHKSNSEENQKDT